jgi:hypothetical protein
VAHPEVDRPAPAQAARADPKKGNTARAVALVRLADLLDPPAPPSANQQQAASAVKEGGRVRASLFYLSSISPRFKPSSTQVV